MERSWVKDPDCSTELNLAELHNLYHTSQNNSTTILRQQTLIIRSGDSLHQFCLPLGLLHLSKPLTPQSYMRPLCGFLTTRCDIRRRQSRLRKGYFRVICCETRNTNIMVTFCGTGNQIIYFENEETEPRCSWRSLTSKVSPLRCLASRHEKFVTESINSSAIDRSN